MARWETALVTGASSGIGAELARVLARRGVRVALVARRRDALEALAQELGEAAVVIVADVSDPAQAQAAVEEAMARLGHLDLVIANAGTGMTTPAERLTLDRVIPVLSLNVLGAAATLTAAIPGMVARARGHLVCVTSLAGYRGLPTSAAYSASKAAMSTFLESLRVDLAPKGLLVTDVQPGFVDTPLTRKNAHPMPLLMSADRAAESIVRALEQGRRVHAFPWPMAALMRVVRWLPAWGYEPLARRLL